MYRLKETTPPANDPVTLAMVLSHLNLASVDAAQQVFIEGLIRRAAETFEKETARAIITAEWLMALDAFPSQATIQIPRPPLQLIDSIKYYDSGGALQTLDSSKYRVHTVGLFGEVEVIDSWPSTQARRNAVEIRFTAGYGDDPDDVPAGLQQGILTLIAHWYVHREMVSNFAMQPIPQTAQDVIYRFKAEV